MSGEDIGQARLDAGELLPGLLIDDAGADGPQLRIGVPQSFATGGVQIRVDRFLLDRTARYLPVAESTEIDRELSHPPDEISRLRGGGVVVRAVAAVDHAGDLPAVQGGDGDEDADALAEHLLVVVMSDERVDLVVAGQLRSALGHGPTAESPSGADDEGREQVLVGASDGFDRNRPLFDHASEDDVACAALMQGIDGFDEQAAGLDLESPRFFGVRIHVNKLPTFGGIPQRMLNVTFGSCDSGH